ncbi:restriction endonuclease subunit S [Aquimarina algiphila]|uniref:Type I restriction modification DNA specificity domain-containing protein n=1 Tax=Aquimarina algiphila TaxID=2047982 RepID=A0A554VJI0_9FLAO|nr:restriction endonuclease subunit S [Aquimarina algiphila]TSE08047.1 hypothetical protein FOF46_14210 [Aquimarina algiphila]
MKDNLIIDKFQLPQNWEIETLENLTTQIVDGTHHTPHYTNYGVPFLRVTDVQTKEIDRNNIKYISKTEHKDLIKRCKPVNGDLLLSKNGTIGIPKVVDWNWEFSIFVSLALIKLKPQLDVHFLAHFLKSDITKWQILRRAKQGTVTNLHLEEIREVEIPKLSLIHQKKIAQILSVCDAVIEKTEEAIAKYQAIKKGMMQDLFTRGIDIHTGKLRPKYKDAPEFYKESELGMIPKEWKMKRLENCGMFSKGHNIPKYLLSSEGFGCILYGQLYTKFDNTILNVESKVPKETFKHLTSLKYGSILFAGSGETHKDIGKSAVFLIDEKTFAGGDIVILELYQEYFKPYFGYFLNFEHIQRQKSRLGQGSSVIHIYSNHLGGINMSLPDKIEQEKIYNKINLIDRQIKNEQSTLHKYQQIKTGLMHDLLTGKVEVTFNEEKYHGRI